MARDDRGWRAQTPKVIIAHGRFHGAGHQRPGTSGCGIGGAPLGIEEGRREGRPIQFERGHACSSMRCTRAPLPQMVWQLWRLPSAICWLCRCCSLPSLHNRVWPQTSRDDGVVARSSMWRARSSGWRARQALRRRRRAHVWAMIGEKGQGAVFRRSTGCGCGSPDTVTRSTDPTF